MSVLQDSLDYAKANGLPVASAYETLKSIPGGETLFDWKYQANNWEDGDPLAAQLVSELQSKGKKQFLLDNAKEIAYFGASGPYIQDFNNFVQSLNTIGLTPTEAQQISTKVQSGVADNANSQQRIAAFNANFNPGGGFGNLIGDVAGAVNQVAANPVVQIGIAYYMPGLVQSFAPSLGAFGITSAAAQTAVANAIASTAVQVAQGVPFDQAFQNAVTNAVVSSGSPAIAKDINKVIENPAVTDAIVSAGSSAAKTALNGGSQSDIERNLVGGLLGSATASSTGSTVAGSAVGGGVTGGVLGALSGAASAYAAEELAKEKEAAEKEAAEKKALIEKKGKDFIVAAGDGFNLGQGGNQADKYGMTPTQKQGIVDYLNYGVSVTNSGVEIDNEGNYLVSDNAGGRQLKFSSDGTFLGSSILISLGDGKTSNVVSDFLNSAIIKQIPETDKFGTFAGTTPSGTGGVTDTSGTTTGTDTSGTTGTDTSGTTETASTALSDDVINKIPELGALIGLGTPDTEPAPYSTLIGAASGGNTTSSVFRFASANACSLVSLALTSARLSRSAASAMRFASCAFLLISPTTLSMSELTRSSSC